MMYGNRADDTTGVKKGKERDHLLRSIARGRDSSCNGIWEDDDYEHRGWESL